MPDDLATSIQRVSDDFHLKYENVHKLNSVYDDLDDIIQLIHRGQNYVTLHSTDCEELEETSKKTAIKPYDTEMKRLEDEYSRKSEKEKYFENSRYVSYRQHVWSVNNPDEEMPPLTGDNGDEEIVMGRTKLSFKCPITTSWLEVPMTSKLCKHSYTKSAIFQLLGSYNGAVLCPLSGCNKIVRMNILYADDMLADKVKRAREKAEESQTTDFYDVE